MTIQQGHHKSILMFRPQNNTMEGQLEAAKDYWEEQESFLGKFTIDPVVMRTLRLYNGIIQYLVYISQIDLIVTLVTNVIVIDDILQI